MGKVADFFSAQSIVLPQQQKRQMLALDKEFVALESKVTRLDAENLQLRAEVNPLKGEVERLQQQFEQQKAPSHKLEQSEVNILKAISAAPEGITSPQLQRQLGASQPHVEHFLNELREKEYIEPMLRMSTSGHSRYVLHHKGNAYLVKHGLA